MYDERLAIVGESDSYLSQMFTLRNAFEPREPIRYAIDGLFSPGLSMPYGSPGTLKSMLMQSAAVHIAGGLPWLGRGVRQCPVLWVDLDNGLRRTHERFAALARGAGLDADIPLFYLSMPRPWLDGGNTREIEAMGDRILSLSIGAVFVDNLGLMSPGADENTDSMIAVMGNLRALCERTGICLILIHHQRKSTGNHSRAGESLRGHSSIEASLDLALLV